MARAVLSLLPTALGETHRAPGQPDRDAFLLCWTGLPGLPGPASGPVSSHCSASGARAAPFLTLWDRTPVQLISQPPALVSYFCYLPLFTIPHFDLSPLACTRRLLDVGHVGVFTQTLAWAGRTCPMVAPALSVCLCPLFLPEAWPVRLGFLETTSPPSLRVCETLDSWNSLVFPSMPLICPARPAGQSVRPGVNISALEELRLWVTTATQEGAQWPGQQPGTLWGSSWPDHLYLVYSSRGARST